MNESNKQINVTRSSMPPFEEYVEEIRDLWDSRWLTNSGAKHQILEKEMEKYLGVSHISFFSNGHLALEMVLDALKLTGEVITTPFTYASTTQAIVRRGLTPVFCDIEPDWYTMDVSKIESLITEKTCAIVPVHVYGNVCQYKEIERIAKKYGLAVIYDAAHAFGVRVDGKGIGTVGDAAMFSFHATKVLHTIEGGAVTYADGALRKDLEALKMFGMYSKDDAELIGSNAKMTEFQAAMGLCNLRHVDQWIGERRAVVMRYRERLSGVKGLRLCPEQEGVESNYAYFPVYFDAAEFGMDRNEVLEKLAKENIFARKYFYPLTSEFSVYQGRFLIQKTPVAFDASRHVLTLPLYSELSVEDVDRICDVIVGK